MFIGSGTSEGLEIGREVKSNGRIILINNQGLEIYLSLQGTLASLQTRSKLFLLSFVLIQDLIVSLVLILLIFQLN